MNGVYCPDILIDTGATQTLVHSRLVTDEDILDDEVTIKCAHGDTVAYPLAAVKINIAGRDIVTTAAVSKTLPASVLLGWDIPEFMTYVTDITPQDRPEEEVLAVVTRRQQKELQNQTEQEETHSQATPTQMELTPIVTDPETADNDLAKMDDSLFLPASTPRPAMTRSQKRENCRQYHLAQRDSGDQNQNELNLTADGLRELQESDGSLQQAREIADGKITATAGEEFFTRDGLLYRRFNTDDRSYAQLVLPTQCRSTVL